MTDSASQYGRQSRLLLTSTTDAPAEGQEHLDDLSAVVRWRCKASLKPRASWTCIASSAAAAGTGEAGKRFHLARAAGRVPVECLDGGRQTLPIPRGVDAMARRGECLGSLLRQGALLSVDGDGIKDDRLGAVVYRLTPRLAKRNQA